MKNLKSKIRLSLCLLTVCFSIFAQTDSHDCEVIVTRADLEKCATFKRQNELLEKQVKFQTVETTTLRDTIKARNNSLIILEKNLEDETKSKVTWRKTAIILIIILALLIILISFGHKLAKFIAVFCLFSIQSISIAQEQMPSYNPPFTLNGQKGISQKMLFDTTGNTFSVFSINNTHTFRIPYNRLFIAPGNQFQYYRGDKTWQTLNKTAVGLNNVDNTADISKPISTATQSALDLKLNISTASSTYFPLSGGTITGATQIRKATAYNGFDNLLQIGGSGSGFGTVQSGDYLNFKQVSFTGVPRWTIESFVGGVYQTNIGFSGPNVGIKTSSPTYALDVNGDFRVVTAAVLPTNTTIGPVTSTNLGFIAGLTSNAQNQLNNKITFINVSVANLSDSSTVTHNLNTTKIAVEFFINEKQNNQISWYADSVNTIKVYLPIRDKPTQKKFTGDVFIAKRQ